MTVSIDFALNRRFGVVERLLFRLVLNGINDAETLCDMLWIFSDEVCANAIRMLVNSQLLSAAVDVRRLSLSTPVIAMMQACNDTTFEIDLPEYLVSSMREGKLLIEDLRTKEEIVHILIPHAKLSFLAKALDFYVCERSS